MHRELRQPDPAPAEDAFSLDGQDVFVMPASVSQKRFWMLEQISPGNPALQIPIAVQLSGPLDPDLVERSLNAIVARHEVLRTHFALLEDEPRQVISPAIKLKLRRIDAGPVTPENLRDTIRREMLDEVRQPLDFSPAPLLRATLVRLTPEEHLLMLTAHHIISDGWSNGLLVRELALFYEAFRKSAPEPLPPLAIQYADYVLWQEGWLKTDAFQKQLHFWKETLTGELPVLDFPADFARRAGPDSGAILETLLLPMELSDALKKFCREEGVTLFMVLYSAYVVLLRRYTGQEQFLVGTTAANRSKPELEELIGLFANLLLFRSDVPDGITFRDFLSCQRELLLGGFANQEAPFELVLEQWQQEQKGGERKTLLQTHFLFQKAFMQPTASGDLAIQPVPSVSPGNTFEFAFGIVERLSEGIRLQMEYRTSLFRGATVRRLLRHFQALLESIVARPEMSVDELSLFAAGEREELEAATQSASTEANRSAFDPAVTVAELERDLERHFEKDPAPFTAPTNLPPGTFLIALDSQRRLLPVGIPGDLYLGHRGAELCALPGDEVVHGPVDSPSPVPLVKTGFIGRNAEGGGTELWGRPEDAVMHQGFRLNRRAKSVAQAASAGRASTQASMQESLHEQLIEIWRDILKVNDISIDDNFFECGGTSFLALRMMIRAGKLCGRQLPLSLLLTGATIAHLARFIIETEKESDASTPLIPLRTAGTRPPLFFLHGDWAGGGFYCRRLAEALDPDQPFYALPPFRRMEQELLHMREMAAHHREVIQKQFPHGPYFIGGYCIGATVAIEIARQLVAAGETVGHLFLVDPPFGGGPGIRRAWPWVNRIGEFRNWNVEKKIDFLDRYVTPANRWLRRPWRQKWATLRHRLSPGGKDTAPDPSVAAANDFGDGDLLSGLDYSLYFLAQRLHHLKPLSVPATFYFPEVMPPEILPRLARASRLDPTKYHIDIIPGNHTTCVTKYPAALAEKIGRVLETQPERSRA